MPAVVCGGIVGVTLGTTGAGGSLVAVPLLVYVLGFPVQEATAMSLAVVGTTAGLGAYARFKLGDVRPKAAVLFSVTGAVGAWFGAFGHRVVREPLILTLFGLLVLVAAWRMWKAPDQSFQKTKTSSCADRLPRTGVVRVLFIGCVVGLLTGFFGVGGGFLIVPALAIILGFPMPVAVGTSFVIISWISLGGLIGHLQYSGLDWAVTGYVLLGSGMGMVFGTKLARRANPVALSKHFAFVAAVVALAMIVHNGTMLLVGEP